MGSRTKHRGRRGLSLLEAVVAMGIVAVAILGAFALITSTQQGNRTSEAVNTAAALANDKMEELKAQHGLWERYPTTATDIAAGSVPSIRIGAVSYKLQWTLANDVPLKGMKNINMEVSWGGANLDRHALKTESSIALFEVTTTVRCVTP